MKLNDQQRDAFNQIIEALDNQGTASRWFYLDGPGGPGKTFHYKTLMVYLWGQGKVVLSFETTGIAGTLLKGGRTVHSGFKLPVPLLDTSVSSMRLNSAEAHTLRQASLIIIDEITMLPMSRTLSVKSKNIQFLFLTGYLGTNIPVITTYCSGKTFFTRFVHNHVIFVKKSMILSNLCYFYEKIDDFVKFCTKQPSLLS